MEGLPYGARLRQSGNSGLIVLTLCKIVDMNFLEFIFWDVG
jgi:hypothetical protein